jgi:hypothetical protein
MSERLMILAILAVLLLAVAGVHRRNGRRLLAVAGEWLVVAVLAVLLAGLPLGNPAPHQPGSSPGRAGNAVNVQTISDLPGKVRDWLRRQQDTLSGRADWHETPSAGAKARGAGR